MSAASQRTKDIRLGFGIMHLPPQVNHPARVAERVSTLDLISNGRVEFGTGESSSVGELGGFGIDPADKRKMWEEALEVSIRCMIEEPFTGFKGEHIEMPPRNVVPKPLQKPHPPVWVACTRPASVSMAAQKGLGALSFAYTGPGPLTERVNGYYKEFEESAVPVTPQMNPNILAIGGDLSMMVAPTDEQAIERLGKGGGFFAFGIMHYYMTGMHTPGRTGVWKRHLEEIEKDPSVVYGPDRGPIGSPATVREFLRGYEESGVDELIVLLTPRRHEETMESIELMGKEVLPEFIERHEKSSRREGETHGADPREGRGTQAGVQRARLRRDLRVRWSAHRSGELHRQRGVAGDGRDERRYRSGCGEAQVGSRAGTAGIPRPTRAESMGQIDELWRYDGRRAVVTGCASGIGAQVARQLTELGAEVVGLDLQATCVAAQGVPRDRPVRPGVDRQGRRSDRRPGRCPVQHRRCVVGHRKPVAGRHDQLPRHAAFHRGAAPVDAARIGDRQRLVAGRGGATGTTPASPWGCWTPRRWPRASNGVERNPEAVADGGGYRLSKEAIILYGMANVVALGAKGIRINCTAPGVTDTPILDQLRTAYGQEFLDIVPDAPRPCRGPGRAGERAGVPQQRARRATSPAR